METSPSLDAGTHRRRSFVARGASLLEREAFPLVVTAGFALVVCEGFTTLRQDGWLALVGGREIVRHGLPGVDHLALWTAGKDWIDQQWLGQLSYYAADALGGLRLVVVVHALVAVATFALAVIASRRLGGSPGSTAIVAAVAFVPIAGTMAVLRTQAEAGLLFVVVLWLLIADSRDPGRRVFLVLPALVVWANVHGSVVLGAGLCALAGCVFGGRQLLTASAARRRGWQLRSLLLVVLPCLCIFASPYASSLPRYYRLTLFNHDFGKFVTEWHAPTLSGQDIPVFVLAGGGLYLLGRAGSRVALFERLAFVAVAIAALLAVRNVGWLGLTAILVLPATFGSPRATRTQGRVSPVALGLVVASAGAIVLAAAAAAAAPGSTLSDDYPPRALAVVATHLRGTPSARVFANERYADWLLWELPEARGRVVFDARFELLSSAQLRQLYRWAAQSTDGWRRAAAGASLAVIPHDRQRTIALRRSGARVLYSDDSITVLALPRGFGGR